MKQFPSDFLWGVSTSSFQIEGASFIDGKGKANWDIYPLIDGVVYQNQDADMGCDHYHHMKEDIALLARLGVKAYRFSFSWPRLFPKGVGEANPEGFAFYDALLDELERYGILPVATMFHWDYPEALVKLGGWTNEDSPFWFEAYAKALVERYGKRIKYWIPVNEPPNAALIGGVPFRVQLTLKEQMNVVHRLLLSHGLASRLLHKAGCLVGTALCGTCYIPASSSQEDIEAARKANFDGKKGDIYSLALWSDPLVFGRYPFEGCPESELPDIGPEDMGLISDKLDFIGLNLYTAEVVRGDEDGGYKKINHPVGNPKTNMDWEFAPRVMFYLPKFFYERYGLPIVITENGCAITDILSEDGRVHDGPRIEYMKQYLKEYRRAMEEGVPLFGYFAWSFMDNFEWFNGYSRRFGLVYIDYKTKKRYPKDSYMYYQRVIASNGEEV